MEPNAVPRPFFRAAEHRTPRRALTGFRRRRRVIRSAAKPQNLRYQPRKPLRWHWDCDRLLTRWLSWWHQTKTCKIDWSQWNAKTLRRYPGFNIIFDLRKVHGTMSAVVPDFPIDFAEPLLVVVVVVIVIFRFFQPPLHPHEDEMKREVGGNPLGERSENYERRPSIQSSD